MDQRAEKERFYVRGRTCNRDGCERAIRDNNRSGFCEERYRRSGRFRPNNLGRSTREAYYYRERR